MSNRDNREEDTGEDEMSKDNEFLRYVMGLKERISPKEATGKVDSE